MVAHLFALGKLKGMKLTPRVIAGFSACAIVAAVVTWRFVPGFGRNRTGTPPSAATQQPAISPPKANADGLALERDHAAVFQRAFWRRPTKEDRILHAERRDWLDASNGVEKWQWFIAVRPSPAFRDWFLKENPFELVTVSPDSTLAVLSSPPDWFPSAAELALFAGYRNREGRYLVFYDTAKNRLFATDSGGGFAVARK